MIKQHVVLQNLYLTVRLSILRLLKISLFGLSLAQFYLSQGYVIIMQQIHFTKMHGCGNDFVVINTFKEQLPEPLSELAIKMCTRRFGVGADQFILIGPAQDSRAQFRMDILNADGSKVEMCGNALRCAALYAKREEIISDSKLCIETMAGLSYADILANGNVQIAVAIPSFDPKDIGLNSDEKLFDTPIPAEDHTLTLTTVSVGNPHAVTYLNNLDSLDIEKVGPLYEHHSIFKYRANIEFVQIINPQRLIMRVWERGSGETLACGSGACAVGIASILHGHAQSPMTIELKGGELEIAWRGEGTPVYMTGSATFVFDATWKL